MADIEKGLPDVDGNIFFKRETKKQGTSLLKEHIYDFSVNTTLHGLRYVADRRLSLVEKLFWLITFFISIGFCVYRIQDLWIKWRDSPIIVTFNEHLVPAGDVPFPSVTICPQMKVKATKFNYSAMYSTFLNDDTEAISHWDVNELILFNDIATLCHENEFVSSDWIFEDPKPNETIRRSNASLVENIKKVAPSMEELFLECYWRSKTVPCSSLFKSVITAEGLCFNMNSLQANEIFRENSVQTDYEILEPNLNDPMRGWTVDGYYDHNEKDPYPRRGQNIGAKPELSVLFDENKIEHDKTCNRINNGYKVYIQHPHDLPSASTHHSIVIPDTLSSFALKLNIISTPDNLRHISANTRQCFYSDERHLLYFMIYTENNCKLECLSNITYKLCGCVRFSMPHTTSNEICTTKSVGCMQKAMELMSENHDCNCLPSCNSIDYDAEIIRTNFNFKDFAKGMLMTEMDNDTEDDNINDYTFARMDMYYKQPRYISTRRSELFGFTDFLANCGGLLGLFLGFSFLSFIEIIYFSTLRLWCTMKRDAKEERRCQ